MGGLLARVFGKETTGARGERIAENYLRKRGYRTLARNVQRRHGEIDRIMQSPDGRTVVFVEVKARVVEEGRAQPRAEENITARKRAKLVSLARSISVSRGWVERAKRIDVVAVEFDGRGRTVAVRHIEDAVRG